MFISNADMTWFCVVAKQYNYRANVCGQLNVFYDFVSVFCTVCSTIPNSNREPYFLKGNK